MSMAYGPRTLRLSLRKARHVAIRPTLSGRKRGIPMTPWLIGLAILCSVSISSIAIWQDRQRWAAVHRQKLFDEDRQAPPTE